MDETNIETLWRRHYRRDSSSYHENMAATFARMLADPDCEPQTRLKMTTAIELHKRLDRLQGIVGPFTRHFARKD